MYEVLENRKYIVMVMDLCEGGTLVDYTEELPEMRISELEARELIRQVFCVFRKIHALGYVHRDIKPGNLLLNKRTSSLRG